jgi:hypothetical protein
MVLDSNVSAVAGLVCVSRFMHCLPTYCSYIHISFYFEAQVYLIRSDTEQVTFLGLISKVA